jgi:hypothetical protein
MQQEIRGGEVRNNKWYYTVLHNGGMDSLLPGDSWTDEWECPVLSTTSCWLLEMSWLTTIQPGLIFTSVDHWRNILNRVMGWRDESQSTPVVSNIEPLNIWCTARTNLSVGLAITRRNRGTVHYLCWFEHILPRNKYELNMPLGVIYWRALVSVGSSSALFLDHNCTSKSNFHHQLWS